MTTKGWAVFWVFLIALSCHAQLENGEPTAYDKGENGIWVQHGWLGDDVWFKSTGNNKSDFRSKRKVLELARRLRDHRIAYVYPHLCPTAETGELPGVDHEQTELVLDGLQDIRVVPWVGGVYRKHCLPESKEWRTNFISSVRALLDTHPRLAGVQINIEPMPSGHPEYLLLLSELKSALPKGKMLSVAAYPPPTDFQPNMLVHWEEDYFKDVSQRVDQMVPMMYDTAIRAPNEYVALMTKWTRESLLWAGKTDVLLGLPAYDDAWAGYHDPKVENLENSLIGFKRGLLGFSIPPNNYRGVALYCDWEMDSEEWKTFSRIFLGKKDVETIHRPWPTPNPTQAWIYIAAWSISLIFTVLWVILRGDRLCIFSQDYVKFILVSWKWITAILATGLLIGLAPYANDPSWDRVDAAFMSVLTFLTAPWVVGTWGRNHRFKSPLAVRTLALLLGLFVSSWSYDLYLFLRDGQYPVTWLGNLLVGPLLYTGAGLFWNLAWGEEKGIHFSYLDSGWPATNRPTSFRKIVIPAVILMVLAGAAFIPYLWLPFKQWLHGALSQ